MFADLTLTNIVDNAGELDKYFAFESPWWMFE